MYPVVMHDNDMLKIVSVTGAHSKVGKTTLASLILKNLEGFGAIKFTKTPLYTTVTDESSIIMQHNKDTAILAESGAEKVVWIQSPASGLQNALDIAVGKMSGLKGVVVEGNSPVDYLKPHLVVFIVGADGKVKSTAGTVSQLADVVVVNSENRIDDRSFLDDICHNNPSVFWIDLINGKGEIEGFVDYMKKHIKENH